MKKNTVINLTYCHRMPERSFFWRGKQLPVCARCTGIHIGYLSFPIFLFGLTQIPFWITLLLVLPAYVDGTIQAFLDIESNNTRRFITGLISGVGSSSLISHIGIFIGKMILNVLNT